MPQTYSKETCSLSLSASETVMYSLTHIPTHVAVHDRIRRVIDAAFRPFLPGQSNAGLASAAGGYGEHLDYDSFVCFFLCERALTSSTCTERDIRYCFTVLDERGQGRLDIGDLERFFNDTVRTAIYKAIHDIWISELITRR